MPSTPYGVYYDLGESPYKAVTPPFVYTFSSRAHLDKFNRDVTKRKIWLSDSLTRRFGYPIRASVLAALQLYRQIEKRGFLVEECDGNRKYTSPNQLTIFMAVINDGS